jgi:hypothetical protein
MATWSSFRYASNELFPSMDRRRQLPNGPISNFNSSSFCTRQVTGVWRLDDNPMTNPTNSGIRPVINDDSGQPPRRAPSRDSGGKEGCQGRLRAFSSTWAALRSTARLWQARKWST